MIRLPRYLCPLLFSIYTCCAPVLADSAAEIDWRITSKPGQCQGEYVDGSIKTGPSERTDGSPPINASGNSALHVEGHSTTLTGDVTVHQGSQLLRGDFFTMDVETEHYTVEGNVRLRQQGLLIEGARVEGNFDTGTAAIDKIGRAHV